MKHLENQRIEQDVLVDVTCDCCGASCKTDHGMEFLKLETYWGFMSEKDMQHWEAQICEKCVDEKLSFIKFTKHRYMLNGSLTKQIN